MWCRDGTDHSGGPTSGGPQTGEVRSKPFSGKQPLLVHPRQRCTAQQRQQQLEGGIKAALQLLQRAGADLTDRPARQCPLAANPSSQVPGVNYVGGRAYLIVAVQARE